VDIQYLLETSVKGISGEVAVRFNTLPLESGSSDHRPVLAPADVSLEAGSQTRVPRRSSSLWRRRLTGTANPGWTGARC